MIGDQESLSRFGEPKLDPKPAALAGFRFRAYSSAHSLREFSHNGEADPSALVVIGQSFKHFEEAITGMPRNSDPVVLDPYSGHGPGVFSMDAHVGPGARGHKLHGVSKQIRKALG